MLGSPAVDSSEREISGCSSSADSVSELTAEVASSAQRSFVSRSPSPTFREYRAGLCASLSIATSLASGISPEAAGASLGCIRDSTQRSSSTATFCGGLDRRNGLPEVARHLAFRRPTGSALPMRRSPLRRPAPVGWPRYPCRTAAVVQSRFRLNRVRRRPTIRSCPAMCVSFYCVRKRE